MTIGGGDDEQHREEVRDEGRPLGAVADRGRLGQAHDELHEQRELDGGADDDDRVVDETAPEKVVRGHQAQHAARDEQHDGQGLQHAQKPTASPWVAQDRPAVPGAPASRVGPHVRMDRP